MGESMVVRALTLGVLVSVFTACASGEVLNPVASGDTGVTGGVPAPLPTGGVAQTGGMNFGTGGVTASSGGVTASSGGVTASSGGVTASSGGTMTPPPIDFNDLFPPPSTPAERVPSPDNPAECPATAPENPVGDCLGLPVYLNCKYGTYNCICDWYHWLCAG